MVDGGVQKTRLRQHRVISRGIAQIVLNVKNFFKQERDRSKRIDLDLVTDRVMQATKLGRNTVCKISTQCDVEKFKVTPTDTRNREMVVADEFVTLIRQTLRTLIIQQERMPTLTNIMEILQSPPRGTIEWKHSRTTLYKFMQQTGFKFSHCKSHYDYTRERPDVMTMRENYLLWLSKYRQEGYEIYFQDETWANKNMGCSKVWQFTKTGEITYKVLAGKGARCIISHLGSKEHGLLDGCLLLFRGEKSKKEADYHTEMDAYNFQKWMREAVFPKLQSIGKKCVVVLDRATYHTCFTENTKPPKISWRKSELQNAVIRWGFPAAHWPKDWITDPKITKPILLEHCLKIAPDPKYEIQAIADQFTQGQFSIKILFLPVSHPELNPIELAWAYTKRQIRAENFKFNITAFEKHAGRLLEELPQELFSRFCDHAIKEEERYREMAQVIDLTECNSAGTAENEGNSAPSNESRDNVHPNNAETETESE